MLKKIISLAILASITTTTNAQIFPYCGCGISVECYKDGTCRMQNGTLQGFYQETVMNPKPTSNTPSYELEHAYSFIFVDSNGYRHYHTYCYYNTPKQQIVFKNYLDYKFTPDHNHPTSAWEPYDQGEMCKYKANWYECPMRYGS